MGASCCEAKTSELVALRGKQARVLKIVLAINLLMFVVEFTSGFLSSSMALMSDSLDMLGDAIVYGFSLYVLHKSEKTRAYAALLKGITITAFGVWVLVEAISKMVSDSIPSAEVMGAIGFLALAANLICLFLLMRHREDDLNMKSTYICSRNDIISNGGVLVAAVLVGLTGSKWPDIGVGLIIAVLFLRSAWPILREAIEVIRRESAGATR